MDEMAGRYLWIIYNDLSEFEWGGFELLSNGTFTWQYGPEEEKDFNESTAFSGGGEGTWEFDPNNSGTIIFKEDGIEKRGVITPDKYLVIDNGEGEGFTAGIKYPDSPSSIASIAGNYRGLDVTPEGYLGVGSYNITPSGKDGKYYFKYYNNPSIETDSGTMTNFRRSEYINNVFVTDTEYGDETFHSSFILLPVEAMLFFTWGDDSGMVGYGIGGKID